MPSGGPALVAAPGPSFEAGPAGLPAFPVVAPPSGSALRAAALAAPPASAGDSGGRSPGELRLWPPWAFDALAAVLAAVESGSAWPTLAEAEVVRLGKPGSGGDPQSRRPTLLLDAVYRCWAGARRPE